MKTSSITCVLALGLALVVNASAVFAMSDHPTASTPATAAPVAPKLHEDMRSLWHDHIVATRDYALAIHADNKADATKASDAAVANAKQIANAVSSFYGKAAGDQMLKLLGGHWAGVKALTHANNKAEEEKAINDLTSNAGNIAKFLSGANPYLPNKTVNGLLIMHIGDHKIQIDQIMSNASQTEQDKSWAEMQSHMDMIADALASGIAKQFPDKAK